MCISEELVVIQGSTLLKDVTKKKKKRLVVEDSELLNTLYGYTYTGDNTESVKAHLFLSCPKRLGTAEVSTGPICQVVTNKYHEMSNAAYPHAVQDKQGKTG